MRSYPCVVVGCSQDVVARVREGDRLTLKRAPDVVACFHDAGLIGHIPSSRSWVAHLLDDGATPEVTVTGFDIDHQGKLAQIEIAVAVADENKTIRSIISELGDELRILAFVGAADGRLAPAERSVMEQFALARARELGLTQDEDEAAHAVRWARRHAPNMLDIAGIVRKLSKVRPEALPIVWEACAIVAEVDGHIAHEERQSMATLRSLFQQGMSAGKR
jgi:hypothetical protein